MVSNITYDQFWLDMQLDLPPSKSFSKLDFHSVMNHLLSRRNEGKISIAVDITELEDFCKLVVTAFESTCDEQHLQYMRKRKLSSRCKDHLDTENFHRRRAECSPIIIKWAILEATKYSLKHKLTHDEPTRLYLRMLKNEIVGPFHHTDRSNRQYLIVFLSYLERLASQSSSQLLIESWFDRNRSLFAGLCLLVDRPYDCWHHINLKLFTDLAIRYSTREDSKLLVDSVSKVSMSRAIQSLNIDEWKSNLRLMALSAREMGDTDLFYGLESIIKNSDIVYKDCQSIDLIRSNMESNYEETYQNFLDSYKQTNDSTSGLVETLDQSNLVEFLDACIELDRLTQHSEMLNQLQSHDHKLLYKSCLDSASTSERGSVYNAVKQWVSTWTLEPVSEAGKVIQPASYLVSLADIVINNLHDKTKQQDNVALSSLQLARDLEATKLGAFNVVRTDLEHQGLKILGRGSSLRRQTPTTQHKESIDIHKVRLNKISFSEKEPPQLVKQLLSSIQSENAEIPEVGSAINIIQENNYSLSGNQDSVNTMVLISETLNNQYRIQQSKQAQIDVDALNTSFYCDMQVLLLSTKTSETLPISETAVVVLDKIKNYASSLSETNLKLFKSSSLPYVTKIWSGLKNHLVSLVTGCLRIPRVWIDAITDVIHAIAAAKPDMLLYECVVNRLDLRSQLAGYDHQVPEKLEAIANASLLLQSHDQQLKPDQREEHIRQLRFWDGVYQHILEKSGQNMSTWTKIVAKTEIFIQEIRKISYLAGEYLKSLTVRLKHKLEQFLTKFKKHADPKNGQIESQECLDECRTCLNRIYKQESRSISVIRKYFIRTLERSEITVYGTNLALDLYELLSHLIHNFRKLVGKKVLISSELEEIIGSITDNLSLCHTKVTRIHNAFKQKLYLESISPFLSRMESGTVIMPEYIDKDTRATEIITIYKISQNVQMIHSKTAPKKITFIGSDGLARSYLLKAHEDLRLDRLLMELSGMLNSLLACDKDIAKYGYRLERYSVTPVSDRSGLIQWVDAPSLYSFYKTWILSQAGQSISTRLYKITCKTLCAKPESNLAEDHVCHTRNMQYTNPPFYQLLWAEIKKRNSKVTCENFTRPSLENTLQYRKELPSDIWENVIQQLVSHIPQDLIANQLWMTCTDSKVYYTNTRNFIRSCAAHSMYGYIIGLGDRHPSNILIELRSGRVTHIDHNICFEAGRDLSIPERVPFRLTQGMVRAFGFAGLEGGFTKSCERILQAMRKSSHTILSHLNPINFTFMIDEDAPSTSGNELKPPPALQPGPQYSPPLMKQTKESSPVLDDAASNPLDIVRVESGDHDNKITADDDVHELSPVQQIGKPTRAQLGAQEIESTGMDKMLIPQVSPPPTHGVTFEDFHINIKSPKKITRKHAHDIMARVRDKLTGNDEELRSKILASASNLDAVTQRGSDLKVEPGQDLISLNEEPLTIRDQVNCLITEALSNKNQAAMFEGWSPWV